MPILCMHTVVIDILLYRSLPLLQSSFVMGGVGGMGGDANTSSSSAIEDAYRVSDSAWLGPDNILAQFQKRLAELTGLPLPYLKLQSEELQVVRYSESRGQFKPHHDSSAFKPRLLTSLLYLKTLEKNGLDGESASSILHRTPSTWLSTDSILPESFVSGGTWFPYTGVGSRGLVHDVESAIATALSHQQRVREGLISTTGGPLDGDPNGSQIIVKPVAGQAVIFFNYYLDPLTSRLILDPLAVHAGLPFVGEGQTESGDGASNCESEG